MFIVGVISKADLRRDAAGNRRLLLPNQKMALLAASVCSLQSEMHCPGFLRAPSGGGGRAVCRREALLPFCRGCARGRQRLGLQLKSFGSWRQGAPLGTGVGVVPVSVDRSGLGALLV